MRWAEIGLFLLPFGLFGVWRVVAPSRLSPLALGLSLFAVALAGGALAWFGLHERLPDGSRYVPAHLRNGEIVPGHGE